MVLLMKFGKNSGTGFNSNVFGRYNSSSVSGEPDGRNKLFIKGGSHIETYHKKT